MRRPLPPRFLRAPLAHRAYHNLAEGRAENSASAIRAAIDAGYGIEIDVQLSKDGQAMVFHDETLERLTAQRGPVNAHSAEDLGKIALKGTQDRIPILPQVLEIVAGRVPLLIEIKDQTGLMAASETTLEVATAQALMAYQGDVAVMSFNPHSVAAMARLAPQIPRGLTTSAYTYADWEPLPHHICDSLRDIPDYERCLASFISHEAADLNAPRVAKLKAAGAAILCWTIKSPAAEAEARAVADNITFERYAAALA